MVHYSLNFTAYKAASGGVFLRCGILSLGYNYSLSEKRIDMENITTTTTSKYFFTLYYTWFVFQICTLLILLCFFTIICKIKTKIHYEFTTIKTYKFNQQKTKKTLFLRTDHISNEQLNVTNIVIPLFYIINLYQSALF